VGVRTLLVVLVAVLAVLGVAGPASADPPMQVSDPVTDTAGVLGGDAPQVRAALERVRASDGIGVHLVLVSGFDDEGDSDWATESASRSGLGQSDMLLAIDVTNRSYEWWVGDAFPVPVDEVDSLLVSKVEPAVVAGAWTTAATKLTDGLTTQKMTFLARSGYVRPWTSTTTAVVCGIVLLTLGGAHLLSRRRTPAAVK
jgi:TLP18.3/Psb32/MOLO-1 phosphatase superfamily protein